MGRLEATCGGCDARWDARTAVCHCGACHRSFSGVEWFDRHRSAAGEHGSCLDPAAVRVKTGALAGEPRMFFRDGMWRGPEMDEATKLARFGPRVPA